MTERSSLQCILPSRILEQLARSGNRATREAILDVMAIDRQIRLARAETVARTGGRGTRPVTFARIGGTPQRTIHDQEHQWIQTPGKVVRGEGQAAVKDKSVNQAYDGLGHTYEFFWETFERDSIDGRGHPLQALVHYRENYPNALWDGSSMIFGDGDGRIFNDLTAGIDVIGHELTHGVTQYTANLEYSGQSGALNESMSDVLGIMVKQHALKQDVTASDWLIGADVVGPELQPALRSLKEPGRANQHDDQPADMDHYVDGGDVHTNSGIPNHAFYVVATTLGGYAWDAAGRIWYAALTDPELAPVGGTGSSTADFRVFARLTLKHAKRAYGETSNEAGAVQAGWDTVKLRF